MVFDPDTPVLLRVEDAARELSLSRSKLYDEIAAGRLRTVHVGRACRISRRALEEYVESLEGAAERHTASSESIEVINRAPR